MSATLAQLEGAGLVSRADVQLASALGRRVSEPSPEVLMAAALASRQVAAGHVCVDLAHAVEVAWDAHADVPPWPDPESWARVLTQSPLVASAPEIDAPRPLVLDAGRLYLRRYWDYQRRLASALRLRAAAVSAAGESREGLVEILDRLYPAPTAAPRRPSGPGSPARAAGRSQLDFDFDARRAERDHGPVDWQREAVWTAATRRLCVISGGPGTGKTSTVARLLELLIEGALARRRPAPRSLLLAPTGKAAARMLESIRSARERLDPSPELRAALPDSAATLHRALGLRADRRRGPRFGPRRHLPADVVVVDEASMVDLALMTQLVEAVSPDAHLILLGDPDQLASVEAGAVLGDLCRAAGDSGESASSARRSARSSDRDGLAGCVVRLRESRRYGADSGIGRLASAVRDGNVEVALAVLDDETCPDVERIEPGSGRGPVPALLSGAVDGYAALVGSEDPMAGLDHYRVLCALRRGPLGVEALNRAIGRALFGREVDPEAPPAGAPLMVTRNDPELGLYNGDTGRVARLADGSPSLVLPATGSGPRSVALARLPEHELVLAMSVHKSQGSEFDRVDLVLPTSSSPILTRELVYTALTRARKSVRLFASRAILAEAVGRRVHRSSGLAERLRSGDPS